MEIKQRLELKKLLVPQMRQSLKILTLPLFELKTTILDEIESNPFLEESQSENLSGDFPAYPLPKLLKSRNNLDGADLEFRINLITRKPSLQDILIRQLGMFAQTDEALFIGEEIINGIDENGYLRATVNEISDKLKISTEKVNGALSLIQQFEPAGVGARTISECLSLQLALAGEPNNPILGKIIEFHLEDLAKKNYGRIAKNLKEPLENIEPLIKKILRLNPKPGRAYSPDETQRVIPDIMLHYKDENIEITLTGEDTSYLSISKTYQEMLKNKDTDPRTKEFLKSQYCRAGDLLRAISKRYATLRRIVETIVEVQQEAIKTGDLSSLKPIAFKEIARILHLHESTICRAVMNKYVEMPQGTIVALKDFFTRHIHDQSGNSISSNQVKGLIKELMDNEDKKRPLSDQDISNALLKENNLRVPRRTVTKYREDFGGFSSAYRRFKS